MGGAKLLVGLQRALAASELTAIVNTADDAEVYGVHVSPDVDIVMYWLAGVADTQRGWGIRDDTFAVGDAIAGLGGEAWFKLGDRDLATCIHRTQMIASGRTLSEATAEVAAALGVTTRILPMSDHPVRTILITADSRRLEFQEYFVREATAPEVVEVSFAGIDAAQPAPGVLDAIAQADRVMICPSNPIVSIGPILALPGVRAALRSHDDVVAVTPIVRGAAVKGPADRLLKTLGYGASADAVAGLYADICDTFVVDASDNDQVDKVAQRGMRCVALDTIMSDHDASQCLARSLLEL